MLECRYALNVVEARRLPLAGDWQRGNLRLRYLILPEYSNGFFREMTIIMGLADENALSRLLQLFAIIPDETALSFKS